ncbi:hypothetical protein J7L09_02285 [bacterium]|nr:hypothetical protein [bacterium]
MSEFLGKGMEGSGEKGGSLRFVKIIDFLPEEEREKAEYHLNVFQKMNWVSHPEQYSAILNFCNNLVEEKGRSVRKCKLFHLYASSSLPKEEWLSLPLDTPDNDFDNFVKNKLAPLVEKADSENLDQQ